MSKSKTLAHVPKVLICWVRSCAATRMIFKHSKPEPSTTPAPLDTLNGQSQLLYDIVVFSERWSQPPPTRKERIKFAYDALINAGDVERNALSYCLYTGSTDQACEELTKELPKSSKATFSYKRDKYFNVPMKLPNGVSALVINGGLDFATPREFGELLYKKLKGSDRGVMMVNFDYGTHCGGEAVAEMPATPCRDAIVRQFIASGGNVDKVDTTCMTRLPDTVFHSS